MSTDTSKSSPKAQIDGLLLNVGDIVVFGGGVIPAYDIPALHAEGVERIFTPGATSTEIVSWLRERLGDTD